MSNILTLTTGAGVQSSVVMQYVPEQISFVAAVQLQAVLVSVQGDGVICNLDAAGLSAIGQVGQQTRVTNGYIIPLADGFIPDKTVTLTFTNSAAQTPVIKATSKGRGTGYGISVSETALAGQPLKVDKFLAAAFPNAGASDLYNVTYADGSIEASLTREELQYMLSQVQTISNSASDYMLTNLNQVIKSIQVVPVAQQSIYKLFYSPKGMNVALLNAADSM